MNKKERKEYNEFIRALSLLSQVGITIATCVLIGVFLGRFLDDLFGTTPWLLLVFSLIGTASSFKMLFELMSGKKG